VSIQFVNTGPELLSVKSIRNGIRSVLMLSDFVLPTKNEIMNVHDWIGQTSDKPHKYVCFAGQFSSLAHDLYDDIDIESGRNALTTWHENEPIDDTAFFFLETIPMCNDGAHLQVVVGGAKNLYEKNLIKSLKNGVQ